MHLQRKACKTSYIFKNIILPNSKILDFNVGNGFPGGSNGVESASDAGDLCLIPGSGRFPGEGNVIPLQFSCLKNPMNRGARQATVHGVTKMWTD